MAKLKIRPNDPCPCASGKKFKKCCGAPRAKGGGGSAAHTEAERASALGKLEAVIDRHPAEDDEALAEFWSVFLEREEELPPELEAMSEDVFDTWFAFDRRLEDGRWSWTSCSRRHT